MDLAMCDYTPEHVSRFRSKIEYKLKKIKKTEKKTKHIGRSKLNRVSAIARNLDSFFASSVQTHPKLERTFARDFDTKSD
jgi:hypothetical protein